MGAALKFKQTTVPRQSGEQARFKVVQGPDHGLVYVITGVRATIGRGEENDIVISDLKASRTHAEVWVTPSGWTIRDMGSANGIICNGKTVRMSGLKTNDTVTLGETTLEFMTSEASTAMISAPPRSLAQISAEAQNTRKVEMLGPQVAAKKGTQTNASRTRLILIAGVGVFLYLFMFEAEQKPSRPQTRSPASPVMSDSLEDYLPKDRPQMNKSAEKFFKEGFREYRQRNFLRAKSHFETALQISPAHRLATLYLGHCNKQIEEEVKFHLTSGKKSLNAGKLKEARGHFESILRLLYRDQSNPAFVEARDQLQAVIKEKNGENLN